MATQGIAEVIDFQGTGNTIGTMLANSSVAILFQNPTGLNTVITDGTGINSVGGLALHGLSNSE